MNPGPPSPMISGQSISADRLGGNKAGDQLGAANGALRPKTQRQRIRAWLMFAFGVAVLAWLLSRVSMADLGEVLARGNLSLIALGVAIGLTATALRAVRFAQFFAARGVMRRLYGVFAMCRLLNVAMPFKTGEIAAVTMLKKYELVPSVAEVAPAWMVIRLFDMLAVLAWFLMAMVFVGSVVSRRSELVVAAITFSGIAAAALIAVTIAGVIIVRRPLGDQPTSWLGGRIRSFQQGVHRVSGIKPLVNCAVLSLALWSVSVTVLTIFQLAFEVPLGVTQCAAISAIVLAMSLLPVHAPMGVGTVELVWVGVMMLFGLPEEQAIPLAVSMRLPVLGLLVLDGVIGTVVLASERYQSASHVSGRVGR